MNEKNKKAVSLRYDEEKDYAPVVSASGKGYVADEIIKLAKEHHVPIIEDASLVELLAELNVNEYIPDDLFQVVAEVFAFIYHADKQYTIKK